MELTQLKYFKVLAETENLTKTAEKLYLSTPALSGSINRLEHELGMTLFDRSSGKNLKLNDKGRVMLQAVNQILDTLNNAQRVIQEMNKAESASLSIATTTPMLFQDLFLAFRRMYAEIKVTHTYLNLHQLTDVELLKQFDFLIAAPSDLSTNAMDSTVLYRNDRPVLMVYPEHPFAKRDSVAVSELKDEPFIALGNELSSRKMFDEVFRDAGFRPNIIFECDHMMRGKLVSEGLGIGLSTLYTKLCSPYSSHVFVDLRGCTYTRTQALYWHRQRVQTKAAKLFRHFAVAYYRDIDAQNFEEERYYMDNNG